MKKKSDTNLIPAGSKCPCGPLKQNPFCEGAEDDDD